MRSGRIRHGPVGKWLVVCCWGIVGWSVLGLPSVGVGAQLPPSTPEPPLAQPPGGKSAAPAPQPVPALPAPPPPSTAPAPALPAPSPLPAPPVLPAPAPVLPAPTVAAAPQDPPVPVVALRVRVPACGQANQDLKYLICVENLSPAAAHHVQVRVPLPAGARLARAEPPPSHEGEELVWAFGTLSGLCTKEIWLVLIPTGTSDVRLCARVHLEHGECVCTRISRAAPPAMPYAEPSPGAPAREKEQPPGQARFLLQGQGPASALVGRPVRYTLTLTNTGAAPATNTLLTASFPEALEFVSASDGGRHVQRTVAWLLGTLEAGAQRSVTLTLQGRSAGKHCLALGALADAQVKAQAEVCTVFQAAPAARLKMVDTRDPIAVGEETSYQIEVLSQGSLPLTQVRLRAWVPKELALVTARGPTPFHAGKPQADGQEVLFDPYPQLPPQERLTYEVVVRGVRPGDARFRVVLTAAQLQAGGPVREEESTQVFQEIVQHRPVVRRRHP
jgi:uncharacterized repeat protein (TIGR01451 family)